MGAWQRPALRAPGNSRHHSSATRGTTKIVTGGLSREGRNADRPALRRPRPFIIPQRARNGVSPEQPFADFTSGPPRQDRLRAPSFSRRISARPATSPAATSASIQQAGAQRAGHARGRPGEASTPSTGNLWSTLTAMAAAEPGALAPGERDGPATTSRSQRARVPTPIRRPRPGENETLSYWLAKRADNDQCFRRATTYIPGKGRPGTDSLLAATAPTTRSTAVWLHGKADTL